MNVIDALLLSLFSVICHTIALHSEQYSVLLIERILIYIPLSLLMLYVTTRILRRLFRALNGKFVRCCSSCLGRAGSQKSEREFNEIQDSSESAATPQEPLNQPTCTVISYGTCDWQCMTCLQFHHTYYYQAADMFCAIQLYECPSQTSPYVHGTLLLCYYKPELDSNNCCVCVLLTHSLCQSVWFSKELCYYKPELDSNNCCVCVCVCVCVYVCTTFCVSL